MRPEARTALRVGSVASGIGGDAVAWEPLGWETVFFSEIARFPSAVLAHRFPRVPNLGDFTAADFCERARACGHIDVLAAGTPCQAFSVAGKRGSLEDERGNLTLVFLEVVHALDPALVVWENVPGVLSTKDNAFGCFLGGMVGSSGPLASGLEGGRWPDAGMVIGPRRSLAWRVLDAQYIGLAQRRRRVCVVSFRARDGINPGAVLLEPESLRRDSPPRREEGAGVAGTLAPGPQPGGASGRDAESGMLVANTLPSHHGRNAAEDTFIAHTLRAEGFDAGEDGTGRGTPIVAAPLTASEGRTYDHAGANKSGVHNLVFQQHGSDVGKMGALRAGRGDVQSGVPFVAFDTTQITHPENRSNPQPGDPSPTLAKDGHAPALAFTERTREGGTVCESQEGLAYALLNPGEGGRPSERNIVDPATRVRRLTPRESERLQGFPDDWTLVPYRGRPAKVCADSPRYKALGNAWAVPVFSWIGERIGKVLEAIA